ncbi:MFS transporter [Croceibacterium sp. TMG7-5b_MA50]|uniref:MFS transporter n=1 Tax=Croceibacterium sp. TMG7-5b_MA50 TaxID=3121290 RepID=UPI003221A195
MITPRSPAAHTARLRRLQVTGLALLVLTGTLNYLDRSALSIANGAIREEMQLTLGQMGILLSAFSWSYAVAQLPIGGVIDRFRPRVVLAIGIIVWSVAQAACGLVRSFGAFIGARVVLGVGESPQYPAAARVVSDWFPRDRRGMPTGIFNAASPLGTALAPPLLSLIIIAWGWREMFVVLGIAGFFVAAIWWVMYRNPADVALLPEERAYIDDGAADGPRKPALAEWGALFRHGTTWAMILGFFGSVYLNWLYLTWLPSYLQIERGMDTIKSGFAAFVPFFCGFIGCLVAGWLSDWLVRRTGSVLLGRKYLVVAAMFGMAAFTLPGALVASNAVALACISAAVFLANVASVGSWALVSAVAPSRQVASLGGLQNFGGFIGGALAPIVTGFVVDASGSFVPALAIGAAVVTASAFVYLFGVRRPITPDHDTSADMPDLPAGAPAS